MCAVVRSLKRRRWGGEELLVFRNGRGGHDVTAADLNDYLREVSGGGDVTVKDFRTWHATVLAVGLAVSGAAAAGAARNRAVARVVGEVASYLGDTPAVARASRIEPRVSDRYEEGRTIAPVLGDLGASSDFGQLATEVRGARGAAAACWLALDLREHGLRMHAARPGSDCGRRR